MIDISPVILIIVCLAGAIYLAIKRLAWEDAQRKRREQLARYINEWRR